MRDFGLGDEAYKRDWMDEAEPLFALEAFDLLRPRGLLALGGKLVRRATNR
jgi:CelD/BcsL family acetyltransferase involved in cellulose biosynthesis